MEDLILVGAGGGMREVLWQIEELNRRKPSWNILGIVDGDMVKQTDNIYGYPLLGDDDYLLNSKENVNVAICVGSPSLRKKIATKLSVNPYISFPIIIADDVKISNRSKIGKGCIICTESIVSVDAVLGDFVFINTCSLVSHDCRLGNYTTLSPDTKLAGNVTIGNGTEIGIGSKVIQGITIGEGTTVGAGSVVVGDLPSSCTAVGVPAKVIK